MVTLPPSVRLFVATTPVDGRKGFDALSLYVQSALQLDTLSGVALQVKLDFSGGAEIGMAELAGRKNNRCFGTTVREVGGWIVPGSATTADILH
jgi:hypothetical protein